MLDDIDERSWIALAGDAGVRPAFVRKTVDDLRARAATEAAALIRTSAHGNDTALQVNDRIQRLARR